jgi:hypothetical protein
MKTISKINKETEYDIVSFAVRVYYSWEGKLEISELRKSYPDINEYLIAMIDWIYEQEILGKKEILERYFELDGSAIQYLQAHWYTVPSQKVVNETSWNVEEIIS